MPVAFVRVLHFFVIVEFVFDGPGPFTEDDAPNFLENRYQLDKWTGELAVQNSLRKAWIFRIRMPFNHLPHPRNWLMKLRKYSLILNGLNSVTFLDQFVMRSLQLVKDGKAPPGIYHACESSPVMTLQVANWLHQAGLRGPACEHNSGSFALSHVQRSAAVLDSSKFEQAYGAAFGDPACSIRWCIDQLLTSSRGGGQPAGDEQAHCLSTGAADSSGPGGGNEHDQQAGSRDQVGR